MKVNVTLFLEAAIFVEFSFEETFEWIQ